MKITKQAHEQLIKVAGRTGCPYVVTNRELVVVAVFTYKQEAKDYVKEHGTFGMDHGPVSKGKLWEVV